MDAGGTIVFIYDDSPVEDYTKAFPIHQEFDAPACTAAIAGTVGNENYLSRRQLHELEAAGWGITPHTVNHCALDAEKVTRDVASDDEHLYVESAFMRTFPTPSVSRTASRAPLFVSSATARMTAVRFSKLMARSALRSTPTTATAGRSAVGTWRQVISRTHTPTNTHSSSPLLPFLCASRKAGRRRNEAEKLLLSCLSISQRRWFLSPRSR